MADWDILAKGTKLEFDTQAYSDGDVQKLDMNHFLLIHKRFTGAAYTQRQGSAQVLAINTTTWNVTTAGARFIFETQSMEQYNRMAQVDTNHFLALWGCFSVNNKGRAQVLAVNTTTWAVSTAGARLDFKTDESASNIGITTIPGFSNRFLATYSDYGTTDKEYWAQVFTVNTSTWAVTTAAARFKVDTADQGTSESNKLMSVDPNHFLMCWIKSGGDLDRAQVLVVNTSTWVVSTAAARLDFSTFGIDARSLVQIDSSHFYISGQDAYIGPNAESNSAAQILKVNTSTWAVSTAAAKFVFETLFAGGHVAAKVDVNHVLNVADTYLNADWINTPVHAAAARILEINTTNWGLSNVGTRLVFETNINYSLVILSRIDINHFLQVYNGADGDGFVNVLEVKQPTKDKFFALL